MLSRLLEVPEPGKPIFQGNSSLSRAVYNPASVHLRGLIDQFGFPLSSDTYRKIGGNDVSSEQLEKVKVLLDALRNGVYPSEKPKGRYLKIVFHTLFPGKSQKEIAEEAGITESLLSFIASGERTLTPRVFKILQGHLDKDTKE